MNKPQPQSAQQKPTKKIYRRPSVQVYGTLSQVTGSTAGGGRAADGSSSVPNGPNNNRT